MLMGNANGKDKEHTTYNAESLCLPYGLNSINILSYLHISSVHGYIS
jgi:hypothetical protein